MAEFIVAFFDSDKNEIETFEFAFSPHFIVGHTIVLENTILNRAEDKKEDVYKKYKILEIQHKIYKDLTLPETKLEYYISVKLELIGGSPE